MSNSKRRQEFIDQLIKSIPDKPADLVEKNARLFLRHAKTHSRLAEMSCNGHPIQGRCPPVGCDMVAYNARVNKLQNEWDAYIEKREGQIEKRITTLASELGIVANFGGDPRGFTVKLQLPDGAYNSWGGKEDGFGVPS